MIDCVLNMPTAGNPKANSIQKEMLTCLIDRLEKSFDLHFTWSSINHLSPNLEKNRVVSFIPKTIRETCHMSPPCWLVGWMALGRKGLKRESTRLLFTAVLHLCIQEVQSHRLREVHKLTGRNILLCFDPGIPASEWSTLKPRIDSLCYEQGNMLLRSWNKHHLWLQIRVEQKISILIDSKYISICSKLFRKSCNKNSNEDSVCTVHHKYRKRWQIIVIIPCTYVVPRR